MPDKFTAVTQELYDYIIRHRSGAGDPVLDALRRETEMLGDVSRMLISREQGGFLTLLVAALGVRSAIEIGTFTGYSAICIARGLTEDGRLICCDANPQTSNVARRHWAIAHVQHKIELRLGAANGTLRRLEADATFDFAFIDADKTGYDAYYELLLPKMKPNGVLIFDNMLWGGALEGGNTRHPDGLAIHRLNEKLAADRRVDCVLLPIADGLMICRKRD